uniref:Uncharacterized protein n=1 Tax=Anguilla anguilla TaxID=7936 RepID=A0A0E9WAT0_ANGAN
MLQTYMCFTLTPRSCPSLPALAQSGFNTRPWGSSTH